MCKSPPNYVVSSATSTMASGLLNLRGKGFTNFKLQLRWNFSFFRSRLGRHSWKPNKSALPRCKLQGIRPQVFGAAFIALTIGRLKHGTWTSQIYSAMNLGKSHIQSG